MKKLHLQCRFISHLFSNLHDIGQQKMIKLKTNSKTVSS